MFAKSGQRNVLFTQNKHDPSATSKNRFLGKESFRYSNSPKQKIVSKMGGSFFDFELETSWCEVRDFSVTV